MRAAYSLFPLLFLLDSGHAADLIRALGKLPICGVACFTNVIPETSCGSTNATCICNDAEFHKKAEACIRSQCESLDALEVARVEAEACDRPKRSKKGLLMAPYSIEWLAWLCPPLQFYSRWTQLHSFAADDYMMMVCWAFYTVFIVLGMIAQEEAFGVDVWTLSPEKVTRGLYLFYIAETFYVGSLGLTKLSVVQFYLRIFPNQGFRYAAFATMGFTVVTTVSFFFMQIFQCNPVHYAWDGWIHKDFKEKCLNLHVMAYSAASFSIVQDVLVLILPLPLLFRLNLKLRLKVSIILMFSLGVFVLLTSCVRLRYLLVVGNTVNPTWDYGETLVWTALEVAVSVIVACLPAIRMLIARLLPQWMDSTLAGYIQSEPQFTRGQSAKLESKKRKPGGPTLTSMFTETSNAKGDKNESQIELGLRLGDRVHGNVQTEIEGGKRCSDASWHTMSSNKPGIQVKTTTTTDVRNEPWEECIPEHLITLSDTEPGITNRGENPQNGQAVVLMAENTYKEETRRCFFFGSH